MTEVFTPQNPIEIDCPICHRVWTPTMHDDCMLPACGCYGDKLDRDTPCESCGMSHAWQCKDRPDGPMKAEPNLIEITPDGTEILRGKTWKR